MLHYNYTVTTVIDGNYTNCDPCHRKTLLCKLIHIYIDLLIKCKKMKRDDLKPKKVKARQNFKKKTNKRTKIQT